MERIHPELQMLQGGHERLTDRQTDRRTDRQTDRQTGWIQYTPPPLTSLRGYNDDDYEDEAYACASADACIYYGGDVDCGDMAIMMRMMVMMNRLKL